MIRKTWLICLFAILAVSQLVLGCATEDKHMDISKKSNIEQVKYFNDIILIPLKNDYISFVTEYELALKNSENVGEFDTIISAKLYNKERNLSDIYDQLRSIKHSKESDGYYKLLESQIDSISDLYNSEEKMLEAMKKYPKKKIKDVHIKLDNFYSIIVEDGFYDIQNSYNKLVYNRTTYLVNKEQFNKIDMGMTYKDVSKLFNTGGVLDTDIEEKSDDSVYLWYSDREDGLDDNQKPLAKIIFVSNEDGIDIVKSKEWLGD